MVVISIMCMSNFFGNLNMIKVAIYEIEWLHGFDPISTTFNCIFYSLVLLTRRVQVVRYCINRHLESSVVPLVRTVLKTISSIQSPILYTTYWKLLIDTVYAYRCCGKKNQWGIACKWIVLPVFFASAFIAHNLGLWWRGQKTKPNLSLAVTPLGRCRAFLASMPEVSRHCASKSTLL